MLCSDEVSLSSVGVVFFDDHDFRMEASAHCGCYYLGGGEVIASGDEVTLDTGGTCTVIKQRSSTSNQHNTAEFLIVDDSPTDTTQVDYGEWTVELPDSGLSAGDTLKCASTTDTVATIADLSSLSGVTFAGCDTGNHSTLVSEPYTLTATDIATKKAVLKSALFEIPVCSGDT